MPMKHDPLKCKVCGKCIDICPVGARSIEDDQLHIDEHMCVDCRLCVEKCEHDAMATPEEHLSKKAHGA